MRVVRKFSLSLDQKESISPSEIDAFEEAGGLKWGLGPRIMRTETGSSTL